MKLRPGGTKSHCRFTQGSSDHFGTEQSYGFCDQGELYWPCCSSSRASERRGGSRLARGNWRKGEGRCLDILADSQTQTPEWPCSTPTRGTVQGSALCLSYPVCGQPLGKRLRQEGLHSQQDTDDTGVCWSFSDTDSDTCRPILQLSQGLKEISSFPGSSSPRV